MTAQEYLSRLQVMQEEIDYLKELRQECLEKATSISVSLNQIKVQESHRDSGKIETHGIRAVDLEREIEQKVLEFYKFQDKIINQIWGLHDVNYQKVLFKVYVQYKSLKVAAQEMQRSYTFVLETHKKALKSFREHYARKKVVQNGTKDNTAVDEGNGRTCICQATNTEPGN